MDLKREQPTLLGVWADQGYAGDLVQWAHVTLGLTLEIVKRTTDGFVILARRWVVEQTIAWIVRNRRLARDFEEYAETTEAWMYLTMVRLMVRRPCPVLGQKAHSYG